MLRTAPKQAGCLPRSEAPIRRGAPRSLQPHRVLQRKCACGGPAGSFGECEACAKERRPAVQRDGAGRDAPATVPPIVDEVLRSPGQPLDAATRAFMEPRFGHDFSGVRVHADEQAAESARAVNALAYTVGPNIAFDTGRYAPGTEEGTRLM